MGLLAVMALAACDSSGSAPPDETATATTATATNGADATSAADTTATTASEDTATVEETSAPDVVAGDPNPLGERLTFATETITVQPGKERQVCKVVNIPGDKAVDIVRIESRMHGTSHHFNLYKVINEDKLKPATGTDATTHDCPPAGEQLAGDAAYIFGAATSERSMVTPAGVAFHLEPGQRLIVEYHGLNYTTEANEGGVEVDLIEAAPEANIEHHADILWMANWSFFLPEGESSDTTSCTVPYNVKVFSIMSHFHELGTDFTIESKLGGQYSQIYENEDWSHPIVEQFDPPMDLQAGDGFRWTCTWDNWRGHVVSPGKNSTDEMCMIFAAAYPTDTLDAQPVQCNVLF